MSERMSIEDARSMLRGKPKRRKYGNRPTEYGGRVFASAAEAAHAAQLDLEKRAGTIRGWAPQVSLPLHPGSKTRLVVDFLVVLADGRVQLQDAKGIETAVSKIKRREVEASLGVPVDIIRPRRRR